MPKTHHLVAIFAPHVFAADARAVSVSYNTSSSSLVCNGVSGCVQKNSQSVSVGGLTLTYFVGFGAQVTVPSLIDLGFIKSTGSGSDVDLSGLLLVLTVSATPPGASGTFVQGLVSGRMSTTQSNAFLTFELNSSTSAYGSLPGVELSDGVQSFTYQILDTTLGLQAPTVGNMLGTETLQGVVVFSSIFANGFQ